MPAPTEFKTALLLFSANALGSLRKGNIQLLTFARRSGLSLWPTFSNLSQTKTMPFHRLALVPRSALLPQCTQDRQYHLPLSFNAPYAYPDSWSAVIRKKELLLSISGYYATGQAIFYNKKRQRINQTLIRSPLPVYILLFNSTADIAVLLSLLTDGLSCFGKLFLKTKKPD